MLLHWPLLLLSLLLLLLLLSLLFLLLKDLPVSGQKLSNLKQLFKTLLCFSRMTHLVTGSAVVACIANAPFDRHCLPSKNLNRKIIRISAPAD